VWQPSQIEKKRTSVNGDGTIRYEVHVDLPPPHESQETQLRILVSLPPSYPASSAPQLQLLSRYIGAFSVDSSLFGSILRTFISKDGVEWLSDTVCVFDGVENVRERCATWYGDHLSEEKANELLRDDKRERKVNPVADSVPSPDIPPVVDAGTDLMAHPDTLEGVDITVAEPITDRKSVFIGRACRIKFFL